MVGITKYVFKQSVHLHLKFEVLSLSTFFYLVLLELRHWLFIEGLQEAIYIRQTANICPQKKKDFSDFPLEELKLLFFGGTQGQGQRIRSVKINSAVSKTENCIIYLQIILHGYMCIPFMLYVVTPGNGLRSWYSYCNSSAYVILAVLYLIELYINTDWKLNFTVGWGSD